MGYQNKRLSNQNLYLDAVFDGDAGEGVVFANGV